MDELMDDSSPPPSPGTLVAIPSPRGGSISPNHPANRRTPTPPQGDASGPAAKTAPGQPKRKPDKSTICRIRTSETDGDPIFPNGNEEFSNDTSYEESHQASAVSGTPTSSSLGHSYFEDRQMDVSDHLQRSDRSRTPSLDRQQHQDAVNNNQSKLDMDRSPSSRRGSSSSDDDEEDKGESRSRNAMTAGHPMFPTTVTTELSLNEQLANSSLTLEAINNTRITLARLASAAAHEETTDKSIHDLSLLQRALYNLQHQQVIQMQLIKQLQGQLSLQNRTADNNILGSEAKPLPSPPISVPPTLSTTNVEQPISSTFLSNLMDRLKSPKPPAEDIKPEISSPDPKDRPLSPSGASGNIASSVIQHSDTPPTSEPNTLEMLQRTANQVLSNASQGLLTNRLIDDYSKGAEGPDGAQKHRCRYCGKVFGSDSALQIHLRSHTGERPFKCNICGNRFTTKGNLKVHFQRHQSRFPHIKMNPHPIPEHLDKLYPPLLAQLGELSENPPAPTGPPSPFPSLSPAAPALLHRPLETTPPPPPLEFTLGFSSPLLPTIPLAQDKPENLTWRRDKLPISPFPIEAMKMETSADERSNHESDDPYRDTFRENVNEIKKEQELHDTNREDNHPPLLSPPDSEHQRKVDSSEDEKTEDPFRLDSRVEADEDEDERRRSSPKKDGMEVDSQTSEAPHLSPQPDVRPRPDFRPHNLPTFPFPGMRFPFPFNFPFIPGLNPPLFQNSLPPPQPRPITIPPGVDPSKDPNVYNNLLPRPGSTDNSWEALIEVKKTSETAKLEELVKNVEYKLEPNQCIICHRVLSCKSALQMHYRTHTGERPFKCKICNHTFTTKGNLKTHMSVHRARPHVGMLHQCPVCHKKFGNALVLQQHIRLHTGESTDLSPEQIAAAEVRDMSSNFQSFPPHLFPPGMQLPPNHPLRNFPPFPLPQMRYPMSPDFLRNQDKMEEDKEGKEDEAYIKFKKEMAMQEQDREQRVAEDLSTRIREENRNGGSSPRRSISPSPSDYSDPGMRESHSENSSAYPPDRSLSGSVSPAVSTNSQEGQAPLNLISRPPHTPFWSPFGLFPQPLTSTSLSPVSTSMPPVFSPLYMPNMPGRGNTTCKICFKTLACQSALEIHYRSHTKERPFKCLHCDRGFTTRGNMKQHLLTHKIRNSEQKPNQDQGENILGPQSTASSLPLSSAGSLSPSSLCSSSITSPPSFFTNSPMATASPSPSLLPSASRERETLNPPPLHPHPLLHPHHQTPPLSSPSTPSSLFPNTAAAERQQHLPPPPTMSSPQGPPQHPPTHHPETPRYSAGSIFLPSSPAVGGPLSSAGSMMASSSSSTTVGAPSAGPLESLQDPTASQEREEAKNTDLLMMNLKRERDGELQLPTSKRAPGCEDLRPLDLHQQRPDSGNSDRTVPHPTHPRHSPTATLPLQVS